MRLLEPHPLPVSPPLPMQIKHGLRDGIPIPGLMFDDEALGIIPSQLLIFRVSLSEPTRLPRHPISGLVQKAYLPHTLLVEPGCSSRASLCALSHIPVLPLLQHYFPRLTEDLRAWCRVSV